MLCLSWVHATEESEPKETEQPEDEPLLGYLDYFLLMVLGFAGYYWYSTRESQVETPIPSYVITPSTMPTGDTGEKGFLSKMKSSKRRMVVFYGSQTGTAEEFAGRLAKEGARYGLKGIVADPEECDMDDLTAIKALEDDLEGPTLAVFMMATYGEGDPTDNAQEFYDWLKGGSGDVEGLNYAVFALGNKTYEHFNAMGIFVDKQLEKQGGKRMFKLGLGDDDSNLEDDFITWKEGFWQAVCEKFNIEASAEDFNMRQYEEKVLAEGDYNPEKLYTGEPARLRSYITQRPPFDVKNPYLAPIRVNRNIHSDKSDRHCMHIELDIKDSRIRYDAGDHVAIYPKNNEELVNRLGELLGVNLDTVFTMTNLDEDSTKKHPFPCPTTYRTALTYYVDITALPRTHIMKELAEYCSDTAEKERLHLMSTTSPEGKDLYHNWVVDSCRHITHILEDMPSCKPKIDHIMELLPRLQPRFYSISSSSRVHSDSIHVTGVVVEYSTKTGRLNKGVATTWLKPMIPKEGDEFKVPIYVRRSQFRLPNRPQTPVIMIGPGTGLAPFRGFIQERAWQKAQDKPVGETHLYFGCRNKEIDFIYRDELTKYEQDGVIQLHTAFSRDQAQKAYVTHRLREHAQKVWNLIGDQGAHLYVCGDAKMMAKDVHNIITEICEKEGNMSHDDAVAYVKKMEQQKRYSADVWS